MYLGESFHSLPQLLNSTSASHPLPWFFLLYNIQRTYLLFLIYPFQLKCWLPKKTDFCFALCVSSGDYQRAWHTGVALETGVTGPEEAGDEW